MGKMTNIFSQERQQHQVIFAMSVGTLALRGILYFFNPHIFERFIGEINPLIAAFVIGLLGVALLAYLLS
jgi:hypothetical protein